VKRRRRGWSPDNHAYQHRSPDPTKIERATATSTVALFFYFVSNAFHYHFKAFLNTQLDNALQNKVALRYSGRANNSKCP